MASTDAPSDSATDGLEPPSPPVAEPAAPVTEAVVADTRVKPVSRSLPRRVWGWFWRGAELKRAKAVRIETSALAAPFEQRARLLLAVGARAESPGEPLPTSGVPVAVGLYRESAFWAARGLARVRGVSAGESLWSSLDRATLERAVGAESRLAEVIPFVEDETTLDVWQLPREQQAHLARDLKQLTSAILAEIELPQKAYDSLFLQRVIRLSGLAVLAALVFGLVAWQQGRVEELRDLAAGKPWRASSSYGPNLGCISPAQQCAESPDLFFHTRDEKEPWVEIDLGKARRFSSVRIQNRRDCCFERAVPLIVEVGNSPDKFREVSRRTSSFTSWLATFSPVEARYVRVRAPSRTALHLFRVRVLP